jgi:hypothetical protein
MFQWLAIVNACSKNMGFVYERDYIYQLSSNLLEKNHVLINWLHTTMIVEVNGSDRAKIFQF